LKSERRKAKRRSNPSPISELAAQAALPESKEAFSPRPYFWLPAFFAVWCGMHWGFAERPWLVYSLVPAGLLVASWSLAKPVRERDSLWFSRALLLALTCFFMLWGWQYFRLERPFYTYAAFFLAVALLAPDLGDSQPESRRTPHWAWVLIFIAIFSGAWLRFHRIEEIPPGLHMDEFSGVFSWHRAIGLNPDLSLGSENFCNFGLWSWFYELALGLGHSGVFGYRIAMAIAGSLALALFFPAMRPWIGWRAALWGSLFFAVSRYGIASSRHCVYDAAGIAMLLAMLYGMHRALMGSWIWAGLWGLMAGIYLHGRYYHHWAMLALMFVFPVFAMLTGRLEPGKGLSRLAVFSLLGWLTLRPMIHYIQGAGADSFMSRFHQVDVGLHGGVPFLSRIWPGLAEYIDAFTLKGWRVSFFNPAGETLMDPSSGLLLLLGIGAALAAWSQGLAQGALPLGLFLAAMLPGILSEDPVMAPYRISQVVPALYGLIGLGASGLSSFPSCKRSKLLNMAGTALALLALYRCATWSWNSYFVRYPSDPAVREQLGGAQAAVAREISHVPEDTKALVSDAFYPGNPRDQLMIGLARRSFDSAGQPLFKMLPQPSMAAGLVLFAEPSFLHLESSLRFLYPGLKMSLEPDPGKGTVNMMKDSCPGAETYYFARFDFPRSGLAEAFGLEGSLSLAGRSSELKHSGLALESIGADTVLSENLSGSLRVPAATEYRMVFPKGSPFWAIEVDGSPWRPGQKRRLGEGFLSFKARLPYYRGPGKAPSPRLDSPVRSIPLADAASFQAARFAKGARARYFSFEGKLSSLPSPSAKELAALSNPHFGDGIAPALERVEPAIFANWSYVHPNHYYPVFLPWITAWEADLSLPKDGLWSFRDLDGSPLVAAWIDGRRCYQVKGGVMDVKGFQLKAGPHKLRVQALAHADSVYWMRGVHFAFSCDGSKPELIPMDWMDPGR
jgi:hypothetical protein